MKQQTLSLENRIANEGEACSIGKLSAQLQILIDIEATRNTFGRYFPAFWSSYSVHDTWGALDAAIEKTTLENNCEVKTAIKYPELYTQALKAKINFIRQGDAVAYYSLVPPFFFNIAREFQSGTSTINEELEQMFAEGEALVKGLKDKPFTSSEDREILRRRKEVRDFYKTFHRAWRSGPYCVLLEYEDEVKSKGIEGEKLEELFNLYKESYKKYASRNFDDHKGMQKALRNYTGKKGEELARFKGLLYDVLNAILSKKVAYTQ